MDAQHFLQHIFRSIVAAQPHEDDNMNDEMPSTEPIVPITTQTVSSSSTAPTEANSMDVNDTQTATAGTSGLGDDEDDLMPELQSVSNSSDSDSDSDRDANEVEMQTVEDDNDSSWTDDDGSEMPGLEPINAPASTPRSSNRRARVEDDDDNERDRRHPSQRVGNVINAQPTIPPSVPAPNPPTPQSLPNVPPAPTIPPPLPRIRATINIPGFLGNAGGPDPFRIFQQRLFQQSRGGTGQPNAPNINNNNNTAPPGNPGVAPMFGGFAITLDLNGTPIMHHHTTDPGGQDFATFRDFAGLFGLGYPIPEADDPERAKKLIDGLEEVPIGLVRRLERVGGGGTAGEEVGGSGGDSGCAICWDRLLDAEGDGFGTTEKEDTVMEHEPTSSTPATSDTSVHVDEAAPASTPQETEKPTHPKIVSLPCAHVFHASCLIPWFSRPNQTTCPTCRFNIDPENLTYVRRPRPRVPPRTANTPTQAPANPAATPTNPGPAAQPGADAAPAPAPAPGPFGNPGSGLVFADIMQAPNVPTPPQLPNNTTTNIAADPAVEATSTADAAAAEAAELASVRESIAQRDRDMARERLEAFAALLGVPPPPLDNPDPSTDAAATTSGTDAPIPVSNDTEHADPPLPTLNAVETAPAPETVPPNTAPSQPQATDAPPPPVNPNPTNQNILPGTIHWGFDIFVGTVPPGLDLDDQDFMMDDDTIDREMEQTWEAALEGGDTNPGVPPPRGPTPGAVPVTGDGTGPAPAPATPAAAPGNNPQTPFGAFPHPMFPGMNPGRNVHVGIGTARSISDAFATLFGGRGGLFGAPPTQGTPTAGPQAGTVPEAAPNPTTHAGQTDAASNAQANTRPTNAPPFPDFISAMLNSIPAGTLSTTVPIPMGQPIPNAGGNDTAPAHNADTTTSQNPSDLNGQNNVNLPPLRQNDAPAAPAPANSTPANGPTPPTPQPQQNALPPFANLFGPFQNALPRQRDGNAPHPFMQRPPRERKAWTLPPAPGPSLRQRVERKEREAGLRCHDVSCGVGPSDEDPMVCLAEAAMRQLIIRPHERTDANASVCPHTFHSSCLVSSERVSLKGAEVNIMGDDVEVSCSVCRGVGWVSKVDWDEGVRALA